MFIFIIYVLFLIGGIPVTKYVYRKYDVEHETFYLMYLVTCTLIACCVSYCDFMFK